MEFILSKLFWVFSMPGNLLILLLLLGAFLSLSHDAGKQRFGHNLCFFVALAFFLIGIFPVGDWVMAPLENLTPPAKLDHVDGILIIGGDERPGLSEKRGQPVYLDSGRRYITFATLAREYPQAQLVYSGGSGMLVPDAKMTDADVVRTVLDGLGVPVNRMLFETKSHNTHQNAVMTAALVHPTPQQKWLLVTSAFHMPRALLSFRKAGWNIYPATTGYESGGDFTVRLNFNLAQHLQEMTWALHEYYGLIAYRLMGYTDTLWPK